MCRLRLMRTFMVALATTASAFMLPLTGASAQCIENAFLGKPCVPKPPTSNAPPRPTTAEPSASRCKSMMTGPWKNLRTSARYRFDNDGSMTTWSEGKTHYGSFETSVAGGKCRVTLRFEGGEYCNADAIPIGDKIQVIADNDWYYVDVNKPNRPVKCSRILVPN